VATAGWAEAFWWWFAENRPGWVDDCLQRALHTSAVRYAGAGHGSSDRQPLAMHLCPPPFSFQGFAFGGTREHEQRSESKSGSRSQRPPLGREHEGTLNGVEGAR